MSSNTNTDADSDDGSGAGQQLASQPDYTDNDTVADASTADREDELNDELDNDFDRTFWDTLTEAAYQRYADGATLEEVTELAARAISPAVDTFSDSMFDTLSQKQARMLREHRRTTRSFRRKLRAHWGPALDKLYAAIVVAEEIGAEFDRKHTATAVARGDALFEALTRLQARTCRIALESHTLLSDGLPMGALARCRTLHELAVTAMFLKQFGTDSAHADLAERYLLHDLALNYKDALEYQKNCPRLGYEPCSDAEMAAMKADYDRVMARFGRLYDTPFGWAGSALGNPCPKFMHLEEAADIDHLRGHYRWACHETHADAKGARMNTYDKGAYAFKTSGRINTGLADPGHMTIISLHQVTVALLLSTDHVSPHDLVGLSVLQRFVDSVGEMFIAAHRSLHDADEHAGDTAAAGT